MRSSFYNTAIGQRASTNPLVLTKLTELMKATSGRQEVAIGLVDGPVNVANPDLSRQNVHEIPGHSPGTCSVASSAACRHGTFIAGILLAKRNSKAPALCPNCTLLVRPIFTEIGSRNGEMPSATAAELSKAIVDCVESNARVINLSAALSQSSIYRERALEDALDYAQRHNVLVIAASGNRGTLGSSPITRHPWVVPVVACDGMGKPMGQSNLGNSIGKRGLTAPGQNITSLGSEGKLITLSGTSAAAPFVTGAIALLLSEFPGASAVEIKMAVTEIGAQRRTTVVPPLLDALTAYETMKAKVRRQL